MPHHDYRPDLMGSAAIEPGGRFEAGSWQSFTLTYTCGKFGIDDRGSLKVAFRMQTDQSMIQCDDPAGPGFTTVETSTGIPLTVCCEHRRNTRPWGISLYVRCDRYLSEGDRVVIRFGDRRQGSPGLRLQTFVQPRFEFRVLADPFASYEYIPLPDDAQPTIGIGPGPGVKWVAILPTLRRAGDRFRLCLKCEDRWGNPSDRVERTVRLAADGRIDGLPEGIVFRTGEFGREVDGLSVAAADAGECRVRVLGEDGELLAESNPLRVEADTPYRHYWSDLHGQSEETVGTNPARDYFAFARDRAFLDICGHQGNDFQITDAFWRELNALTAEFNESGRFVTLPGYEWSGNTSLGGDHNVWYRHEGRPIYRSCRALVYDTTHPETDSHSAKDLLAALRHEDALVTAHIGGRYADVKYAHDARIEPSVEVHSAWGTFEWIVRDAFEANYRVGIVASSDGHDGRPGAKYPGVAEFGSYGGLTCHLLESLDRDHLVEAFRRRHHYATTGARIHLESSVELDSSGVLFHRNPDLGDVAEEPCRRAIMGDIVRTGDGDDEVTFRIDVTAPAPIERIELRDGLDTIETVRPYGESDLGRRVRIVCEGAHYRGRGRNVSWEGTARFEGARIERIAPVNFWNVEQLPRQVGTDEVAWRCVTTGGFSAIDVWLDQAERGVLRLRTSEVDADLELAEIGLADTRLDAGGLYKAVRVFRLPDENATRSMTLRRRVRRRRDADTRLYACVTLENGHQAWPSPIYLIP